MHWVKAADLTTVNLVEDFNDLLEIMLDDKMTEFQYVVEEGSWNIVKR